MTSDLKKELEKTLYEIKEDLEKNLEEVVNNALDIIFKININKEMTGFEITLVVGGPNIILDEKGLHGYWGEEEYHLSLSNDLLLKIWYYLEDIKPC